MKNKAIFILLIYYLGFCFCSGSKDRPATQTPVNENIVPESESELPQVSMPQVQAVRLDPEAPTVMNDISAITELVEADRADVKFSHQWFVNGQEVTNADGDTLDKSSFKKGAWIYCRVQVVNGSRQNTWYKSDIVRVLNSLPSFQLKPPDNFNVPGNFQYQVEAQDPDGDELTFEVLAPIDQGILINPRTGLLTWNINAEKVKLLGENIEIKLTVSDGEGEKVHGSIILNLARSK